MRFILTISLTFVLTCAAATTIQLKKRILGGTAQTKPYPFFASIQNYLESCGGTLLAQDKLITAAHCLKTLDLNGCIKDCTEYRQHCRATCKNDPRCEPCTRSSPSCHDECKTGLMRPYDITVKVLSQSKGNVSQEDLYFKMSDFKIWPLDNGTYANDIAIMYLKASNETMPFLPLLKFPKLDDSGGSKYLDKDLMVIGHGKTGNQSIRPQGLIPSPTLMGRKVRLLSDETCARTIRRETNGGITDIAPYLCVAGVSPGPQTPSCHGDSGSPLFYQSGDETVLIGIASFALQKGCDSLQNTSLPGVYQRISYYLNQLKAV